ncbi:MAG: DUF3089 domain-containing protein [Lachnospiraceae bacterium]|nr:DUF3089 domain-containing protein [Lachnospiraceae bacterium]
MKRKWLAILLALGMLLGLLGGCGQSGADEGTVNEPVATEDSTDGSYKIEGLVGTASDYSDKNNWLNIPEITKEVDTFYIYPTVFADPSEDAPDIVPIDNELMRTNAQGIFEQQASVYEESTNVFAPYYRQSNLIALSNLRGDDLMQYQMQEQRTDLYAALDYYFENYNDGRPFILAGHSQGSIMSIIVLGDYMQAHPEYYERMVAAYPIGFSVTKKWLEEHPYAKFAEGADDTGVIVSWNTEGPGNKGQDSIVVEEGAVSINPLNWKRDDTYAGVEENLGSLVQNEKTKKYEIKDGMADAQIDTERGVVICTTDKVFVTNSEIFGKESLHNGDYALYYANLQKNVADRIDSYLKNK